MAGKDRPSASESFHNSQEALLCPNAASPWWFDVCGTGVILSCLPLLYSASSLPKGPVGALDTGGGCIYQVGVLTQHPPAPWSLSQALPAHLPP